MPKALVPVAGTPLITHSLRALFASGAVCFAVVAAPAEHVDAMAAAIDGHVDGRVRVVPGGADRTASVRAALHAALDERPDVLLVHDAARAFTPPALIRAVAEAAWTQHAVVPVLPVADTIRQVDTTGTITGTPDRGALRVVQTPQGFRTGTLCRAYAAMPDGGSATDDAGLVERLGEAVHTVPGHPHAVKITTPFDLAVAEAVLAGRSGPGE